MIITDYKNISSNQKNFIHRHKPGDNFLILPCYKKGIALYIRINNLGKLMHINMHAIRN